MSRPSVGIFGVGAIGGSVGLRARRNGAYVVGADRERAALDDALALGAIDAAASVEEMPDRVDTYVIAAHLQPTLDELQRLLSGGTEGPSLIIDVASVKALVSRAGSGLPNFVATHPMAGTERAGVRAARADLFAARTWAYVPSGDPSLDERVRGFIETMGAFPLAISAEEHDRAVAVSSHLPQLVASCYARIVASSPSTVAQLRGPVARELLRISGMSFDMWRDVLRANAANVEPQLRKLGAELQAAADELARGSVDDLAPLFARCDELAKP